MEESPETVSTFDTADEEGMPDTNIRVEGTGEQTAEMLSCDNPVEPSQSQTKKTSRQLNYYYRKTANKEKRKYVPYSEQESPSWHLKRYHTRKNDSEKTPETAAALLGDAGADDNHGHDTWLDDSGCAEHQTSESGDEEPLQYTYISEGSLNSTPTESEASISDSEDEEFWSSDEDEEMDCSFTPEEPSSTVDDLSSKQNDEPLYDGSSVSKIFAYVLIVSFVLKHNLSKIAWQDLLRVIAVLLGDHCGEVMKSVYKMKLFLKNYFGTVEPTAIRYCASCLNLLNHGDCKMPQCSGKGVNTFLDLHLEKRIEEFFKDSEFCKLIRKGKEQMKNSVGRKIHDIYHGLDYYNFLLPGGFLTETFNISFTVNTDGVNKFSSSRAGHLWPVYIMINELPKEYRFKKKYIIPAYMYCDKHDPSMITFLSPLMDKLNALHEKGIDIKDSAEGHINVRCLLFVATADLPARADLMNMKRYNAKCACHLCKSEGKGYGLNNLHRCWPFQENEPRNHEDQLSYAATASQKTAVMGVKGHSVFSKLKYPFDLVYSFAIDWMHCVSLGCVKYVMTLLMQDKRRSYFIGAASTMKVLSERLLAIKPPDTVGRYPRALAEISHWKATELKNWLLHYSLPVMHSILQPLYLLHWSLLVGAVGILTSDSIDQNDLQEADAMLQDFVLLMATLYDTTKCTMNIHILQHLASYVARRGPLWAYSCFAFEHMNAFLKPLVHGTHHAKEQIGCALGLCYGLVDFIKERLKDKTLPKEAKNVLKRLNDYPREKSRASVKIAEGYFSQKNTAKASDVDNILTLARVYFIVNNCQEDYDNRNVEIFYIFENKYGQRFSSIMYERARKTDCSVIEYTDQGGHICFGKIQCFLRINSVNLCACYKFKPVEKSNSPFIFNDIPIPNDVVMTDTERIVITKVIEKYVQKEIVKHQVVVEPFLDNLCIIPVSVIRRKCILMHTGKVWVVSRFPNIVEHN